MQKKIYKKPQIDKIIIDNQISLILMSWDDDDDPPPPPPFGAQQANPFEENSFKDNNN